MNGVSAPEAGPHDGAATAARALLAAWVDRFNTREPDLIAELYAEDALLHGTSQPRLHLGRDQIRRYFRGTSTVRLGATHVAALSGDSVLLVGHYEFTRTQDGRSVVSPARFTFVARCRGDAWHIFHHHSSADPT